MFDNNQLELRLNSKDRKTVNKEDLKPQEVIETDEKPLTADELAKKKEKDYWLKVEQRNKEEKELNDVKAKQEIDNILKTIEKSEGKLVPSDIEEDQAPDKPYEDIYPYASNFRNKKY